MEDTSRPGKRNVTWRTPRILAKASRLGGRIASGTWVTERADALITEVIHNIGSDALHSAPDR